MSEEISPEQPRIAPGVATQPPPAIVVDQATVEATVESEATADSSPPSAIAALSHERQRSRRTGALRPHAPGLSLGAPHLSAQFRIGALEQPGLLGEQSAERAADLVVTALTGQAAVPQTVVDIEQPAETRTIPAGEVRLYQAPIAFTYDRAPTSLILTLNGLTFQSRAPAILVSLIRPDGGQIRLASVPVRGPRPGETAPYRRFYDVPERIPLANQPAAADAIARFYAEQYPGVATPRNIQSILAGRTLWRSRQRRLRAYRAAAWRLPS